MRLVNETRNNLAEERTFFIFHKDSKWYTAAMIKPVPSADYVKRQEKLHTIRELCLKDDKPNLDGAKIEKILEAEFMEAWGFMPAQRRRPQKIWAHAHPQCKGFDHCTYYFDAHEMNDIIVTQPYYDPVEDLRRGLTIGTWAMPEILFAPEWSFKFPGRGKLTVLLFPLNYLQMISAIDRIQYA